jgi:alkylation response protein AidB-like acyl-CoA dehydrogenase
MSEIRDWLEENWDPELTVREWWERAAKAGWLFPTWPEGYGGRGLSNSEGRAVQEEFVKIGALGPPGGLGQVMGGPVVARHGNEDQYDRFLPALAAGRESWCQFFSEPEAGSDLAGVRTRAERDGEEWIINGQKVWTSGALTADRGMLLARSDWDQPKHKGLSYFIIPIDQPGIEIRPLKQMNGQAHFNEVFFTDARVSHADLIGPPGDGWMAAVTTLAFERSGLSSRVPGLTGGQPGSKSKMLDRKAGDVVKGGQGQAVPQAATQSWTSARAMQGLAVRQGRNSDAVVRQEIALMKAMSDVAGWSGQRAAVELRQGGRTPGVEANLAKLARSEIGRTAQRIGPRLLGPGGMLSGPDAPEHGEVTDMLLSVPSSSIAGGSDQIQKNIIGERGLGLPKEPATDREMPFRDVPKSG